MCDLTSLTPYATRCNHPSGGGTLFPPQPIQFPFKRTPALHLQKRSHMRPPPPHSPPRAPPPPPPAPPPIQFPSQKTPAPPPPKPPPMGPPPPPPPPPHGPPRELPRDAKANSVDARKMARAPKKRARRLWSPIPTSVDTRRSADGQGLSALSFLYALLQKSSHASHTPRTATTQNDTETPSR